MNKLLAPVLFILSVSAVGVVAQDSKLPKSATDLPRFGTIRPVTRVPSLPDAEKIKLIQAAMKGKAPATKTYSLTFPTKLDIRNSYIDGKARLYFDFASEVTAADDYAYFDKVSNLTPGLRLFYNAPSPGYYIFDFAVENKNPSSIADMTFTNLFVDSQAKLLDDSPHQLFITNIKNAGWNAISLTSKTAIWKFYSVEISQFK